MTAPTKPPHNGPSDPARTAASPGGPGTSGNGADTGAPVSGVPLHAPVVD